MKLIVFIITCYCCMKVNITAMLINHYENQWKLKDCASADTLITYFVQYVQHHRQTNSLFLSCIMMCSRAIPSLYEALSRILSGASTTSASSILLTKCLIVRHIMGVLVYLKTQIISSLYSCSCVAYILPMSAWHVLPFGGRDSKFTRLV